MLLYKWTFPRASVYFRTSSLICDLYEAAQNSTVDACESGLRLLHFVGQHSVKLIAESLLSTWYASLDKGKFECVTTTYIIFLYQYYRFEFLKIKDR